MAIPVITPYFRACERRSCLASPPEARAPPRRRRGAVRLNAAVLHRFFQRAIAHVNQHRKIKNDAVSVIVPTRQPICLSWTRFHSGSIMAIARWLSRTTGRFVSGQTRCNAAQLTGEAPREKGKMKRLLYPAFALAAIFATPVTAQENDRAAQYRKCVEDEALSRAGESGSPKAIATEAADFCDRGFPDMRNSSTEEAAIGAAARLLRRKRGG